MRVAGQAVRFVLLGWCAIHVACGPPDYRPDRPSVLLIVVDTLRADRLGLYGYPRPTSPTLDYLGLAGGIVFRNHHAQSSWTKCSMASLWTARYPVRSGVLRAQDGIPSDAHMPAEILRESGFRTAGLWRNGWVAPSFGFGQGFEAYSRPKAGPVPRSVRRLPLLLPATWHQTGLRKKPVAA